MSDWTDFCEFAGIDPNDPDQFDDWLTQVDEAQQPEREPEARLALNARELLNGLADPECTRCRGTGYLGAYDWNCNGRCFLCLPDERWYRAVKELGQASRLVF